MQKTLTPIAVLFALSLTSCAATTAAGPAPVDPAPVSETAYADVDTIAVAADAFVLIADGDEVARLAATDVEATITGLSAVLGDPTTTNLAAAECSGAATEHAWGDVLRIIDRDVDAIGDYDARVFGGELPSGTTGDPVSIEGPNGEKVGDDITGFIATLDEGLVEGFTAEAQIILDRAWPDIVFPVGVGAYTQNGIIQNIGMPWAVNSGIDC
ncbi:hypothetical protein ABIB15_002825 [Marisediminicola sp. UYEF4]|uniref:hypothetical protein n=1 Tax=Marisediminicola sp. UYEF4 TaxID=1756384 RepID=UPI00339AF6B2